MNNINKFYKLLFKLQNLCNVDPEYTINMDFTEEELIYEFDSYIQTIITSGNYTFENKFLEKCNKLLRYGNISLNNCVLVANLIIKMKLEEQKLS